MKIPFPSALMQTLTLVLLTATVTGCGDISNYQKNLSLLTTEQNTESNVSLLESWRLISLSGGNELENSKSATHLYLLDKNLMGVSVGFLDLSGIFNVKGDTIEFDIDFRYPLEEICENNKDGLDCIFLKALQGKDIKFKLARDTERPKVKKLILEIDKDKKFVFIAETRPNFNVGKETHAQSVQ